MTYEMEALNNTAKKIKRTKNEVLVDNIYHYIDTSSATRVEKIQIREALNVWIEHILKGLKA